MKDIRSFHESVKNLFKENKEEEFLSLIDKTNNKYIAEILWAYVKKSNLTLKELNHIKEQIKKASSQSGFMGKMIKVLPNRRALVQLGPLKEEVMIAPMLDESELKPGIDIFLVGGPDGRTIAGPRKADVDVGRITKISKVLEDGRVVIDDGGHGYVLQSLIKCQEGDEIRYDLDIGMALEVIKRGNKENRFDTFDIPDIDFSNVKGLVEEKKFIKEKIIYPAVYSDKFLHYGIPPIRGMILHGAPGNGKTFIAQAIFNEMKKIRDKESGSLKQRTSNNGFFIINGPELLSKWAGNTEESIRIIFKQAKQAAKELNFPAIIFWDEIDSIVGRRKTSDTYSPEKTVVPTLLTEIQGIEKDSDVILIGASNRPELIDPALMRPGRLGDAIIEIPPPNKEACRDIINQEFERENLPIGLKNLINDNLTNDIVNYLFNDDKPLAVLTKKNGEKQTILRSKLTTGALCASLGEELVRKACIVELIKEKKLEKESVLKLIDKMMLSQIGLLDSGVKHGFDIDVSNVIIDVEPK